MDGQPRHPGEHMLLKECEVGGLVDLTGHENQELRATFLEWLLIGRASTDAPPIRGVRLKQATVTGAFVLGGANVSGPISMEECTFVERPDLDDATLLSLRLTGSVLPGLTATCIDVRATLNLNTVRSTDLIDLRRAKIGGALLLRGCRLTTNHAKGHAIVASQADVGGAVSMVGADVTGQVRMIGARIGAVLNVRSARLSNPGDVCFQGERMEVEEGVWFNQQDGGSATVVEGRIVLDNSRIGGNVDLNGMTLTAPGPAIDPRLAGELVSLGLMGIKVEQSLLCGNGFRATGTVALTAATVAQRISFENATIGAQARVAARLHLSHCRSGSLNLNFMAKPAWLSLSDAETGTLIDHPDTWPDTIVLDGFAYARLRPAVTTSVRSRLSWLGRGGGDYLPQPYEQLMLAYQRAGHEQEAQEVGFAKQHARAGTLRGLSRIWPAVLRVTVGYGYKTWRAAIWLVVLLAVGSIVFHRFGSPVPTTDRPPPFHPVVYTIDLLVPVVQFGQEDAWRLGGNLIWMAWGYVAAGWILTTSVIAGLSRLLKRA